MTPVKCSLLLVLSLMAAAPSGYAAKNSKQDSGKVSPLDRYVQDAMSRPESSGAPQASPGSVWTPASRLTALGGDLRASQVDDLVTILVVERASAESKGVVQSARKSSANASVGALAGLVRAGGRFANLAQATSASDLNGQGTTSRETTLTATLAARVSQVLPNGYLVVEGNKDVQINSERQLITVRGVVRPTDLSPDNMVRSDQLAQMEVRINGKGVVNDAIRRPFILYRILLGLLPF